MIDKSGVRERKFSFYKQDVFKDPNTGLVRDMTEDWSFCTMAREAGVRIFLDMGTAQENWVKHVGMASYPLEVEMERIDLEQQLKKANARLVELGEKPISAETVLGRPQEIQEPDSPAQD